jgi:hypothetical protein
MNRDEYRQLLAERSSLQSMLAGIPVDAVLDRGSIEARLHEVVRQITAVEADTRAPARARLTFRGRPVVGSHGIFAEFGMAAVKAFTDAVSMMAAALARPLAPTGPIPNRDQNQLLITSTAVGSFGFEIEEHREGQLLLDDESAVAEALAQTQRLLEGTVGTDDELTDAAAGVDPRVIVALEGFLNTLATSEAVCALEYGDRKFSFQDVGEIRSGAKRLAQDNLHEEEESFDGEFQGILPKRRTFEFKLAGEDTVIAGKIGSNIADPDALNRHLHRKTRITVGATRVGKGRPRYVLNQEPVWESVAPA